MMKNYEELNDAVSNKIKNACHGLMSPPEIKIEGSIMTKNYLNYVEEIKNFEVRADDIWVISFPKCGTTWAQEMVWLLANGLDFDTANSVELTKRFPFLEVTTLWPEDSKYIKSKKTSIDIINNSKSPRFIKSHLHPSLLPRQLFEVKPKIIYIHRNVKDTALSFYHHFKLWNNYSGTLELFLESFIQEKTLYGSFWEHVLSFCNMRDKENILLLSYEDMKFKLPDVLKQTAKFLQVNYNLKQEKMLLNHLDFFSMVNNVMVNQEHSIKHLGKTGHTFIRKGKVDGWKEEMSIEMIEKFDKWTKEKLTGSDFKLKSTY